MSHVEAIEGEYLDLESMRDAFTRLGGEWMEGQQTYEWWNSHVGDYPIPAGMKKEDLGKCEHAVRFPGTKWEVGVINNPTGKGYTVIYDFYGSSGAPLKRAMGGVKGEEFKRQYGIAVAKKTARSHGYRVQEKLLANGETELRCVKRGRY